MNIIPNQKDMDQILNAVCPAGEEYQAKAVATATASAGKILMFGSLSNTTVYMGVTGRSIIICKLDFINMGKAASEIVIPFDQIRKLKTGHGLVPKQKSVKLTAADGSKFKLLVNGYSLGSKMDDQAGNTEKLIEILSQHAQ